MHVCDVPWFYSSPIILSFHPTLFLLAHLEQFFHALPLNMHERTYVMIVLQRHLLHVSSPILSLFVEKYFFHNLLWDRRKPSPTKIIRQWFWLAQALTVEKPEHKLSFATHWVLRVPSDTPKTPAPIIFAPNYAFEKITLQQAKPSTCQVAFAVILFW